MMTRSGFLVLSLLWGLSGAHGQIISHVFAHDGYPRFSADYAGFRTSESKGFLELYTQISFKDLQFVKRQRGYVACTELEVSVYRDSDLIRQRTFRDTVVVAEFERTTAPHEYRITVQGFILDPGDYQVLMVMRDLETHRAVSQTLPVHLRDFTADTITISDLQFARRIELCPDLDNPFVKNGRMVEPNVPRAYGFLSTSIYLYYEIYGLVAPDDSLDDAIEVTYRITDASGELRKQIHKKTEKPGISCVHSVLIPIADLESGRYILEVEAVDSRRPEKRAVAQKDFIVGWDFLAFGGFTSEELIDQLLLIASPEEVEHLRGLSERFRRAGLLSFWKSRDPSPDTEMNELMLEFYHRVAVANRRFGNGEVKGWQTDQGRIYIKYGPPDSVERHLYGGFGKPYEVWEYLNPRLRFVFVDQKGYGQFQLYTQAVTPDKQ